MSGLDIHVPLDILISEAVTPQYSEFLTVPDGPSEARKTSVGTNFPAAIEASSSRSEPPAPTEGDAADALPQLDIVLIEQCEMVAFSYWLQCFPAMFPFVWADSTGRSNVTSQTFSLFLAFKIMCNPFNNPNIVITDCDFGENHDVAHCLPPYDSWDQSRLHPHYQGSEEDDESFDDESADKEDGDGTQGRSAFDCTTMVEGRESLAAKPTFPTYNVSIPTTTFASSCPMRSIVSSMPNDEVDEGVTGIFAEVLQRIADEQALFNDIGDQSVPSSIPRSSDPMASPGNSSIDEFRRLLAEAAVLDGWDDDDDDEWGSAF